MLDDVRYSQQGHNIWRCHFHERELAKLVASILEKVASGNRYG